MADVGFEESVDSALVNNEMLSFDCFCAIPADDPLSNREVVTPADLDGKPMATLFTDHPTYGQTLRAFEESGALLNTRFETQFFMPMFTFIENGLAYSVVDPLSAEGYRIYRGDDCRVVFRPFRPKVRLMASIMTPAHRSLSTTWPRLSRRRCATKSGGWTEPSRTAPSPHSGWWPSWRGRERKRNSLDLAAAKAHIALSDTPSRSFLDRSPAHFVIWAGLFSYRQM